MMEGPCADSEEKHEPVSGVDIAVAVSLKVLDLDGRLEKRTSARARRMSANDPNATSSLIRAGCDFALTSSQSGIFWNCTGLFARAHATARVHCATERRSGGGDIAKCRTCTARQEPGADRYAANWLAIQPL